MTIAARWIRLEIGGARALGAVGAQFALTQAPQAPPAVLWTPDGEERSACVLLAPLKFAPGRTERWRAWAMTPLVAAYRRFGLRAYFEAGSIRASGREIAAGQARTAGACALVSFGFLARPTGIMDEFRTRIEAQHGWQFDHSWPTAAERAAIDEALAPEVLDAQ